MSGHQYAVRRVKCSPHAENIVYSASYGRGREGAECWVQGVGSRV